MRVYPETSVVVNKSEKKLLQISIPHVNMDNLTPELGSDPEGLVPGPAGAGGLGHGHRRVVGHLLSHKPSIQRMS